MDVFGVECFAFGCHSDTYDVRVTSYAEVIWRRRSQPKTSELPTIEELAASLHPRAKAPRASPAQLLGRDDFGSHSSGKLADIVAKPGDLLADIEA